MRKPVEIDEKQRDAFADLFRQARRERHKTLAEVAAEVGVDKGVIHKLEYSGPFPGMRVIDMFRLVGYYGLDLYQLSDMLGVPLPRTSDRSQRWIAQLEAEAVHMDDRERLFMEEMVNVIVYGLRAKRMLTNPGV